MFQQANFNGFHTFFQVLQYHASAGPVDTQELGVLILILLRIYFSLISMILVGNPFGKHGKHVFKIKYILHE